LDFVTLIKSTLNMYRPLLCVCYNSSSRALVNLSGTCPRHAQIDN